MMELPPGTPDCIRKFAEANPGAVRVGGKVAVDSVPRGAELPDTVAEAGVSEAEFQRQVIEYAQAQGWACAHFRKVRVQRKNGDTYWETPVAADGRGFPDLLLVRGGRCLVAELKVGRNTTTPEQDAWLARMRAAGIGAAVWRPADWPAIRAVLA